MTIIHAIVLGIVQGLSEFLPISSTAHLTLAGRIFGLIEGEHPEAWTAFIAVMQLGTLAAVLVYFAKDLWKMITSFLSDLFSNGQGKGWSGYCHDSKVALYIVLGTLPVAVIGLKFKSIIEGQLTKSTLVIACSMVALALLLWVAEKVAKHMRSMDKITWKDALVIGCAQVCALIPGSSRSGTTITGALFMGLTREAAARFSFLLSIPAVLASGLLEVYKVYELSKAGEHVFHLGVLNLIVATVVSGIVGYVSIAWLLRYLTKNTTMVFVWYRLALGALLFGLLAAGIAVA